MAIKIDDGIPITPPYREGKYPFNKLEVGQSFEVETDKPDGVAVQARQWAARHKVIFTTRKTEKGVRIWRKA